MTVADRIKNARIEKGYTQSQLAKLIGVEPIALGLIALDFTPFSLFRDKFRDIFQ